MKLIVSLNFVSLCISYTSSVVSKLLIPPPQQPSGRVLALSAGGPGFNPQSRTESYQRRYKNGNSSSPVWFETLKRALSQELR